MHMSPDVAFTKHHCLLLAQGQNCGISHSKTKGTPGFKNKRKKVLKPDKDKES